MSRLRASGVELFRQLLDPKLQSPVGKEGQGPAKALQGPGFVSAS